MHLAASLYGIYCIVLYICAHRCACIYIWYVCMSICMNACVNLYMYVSAVHTYILMLCVMTLALVWSEIISLSECLKRYSCRSWPWKGSNTALFHLNHLHFPWRWRQFNQMIWERVLDANFFMQMCVTVYIMLSYVLHKSTAPIKWLFTLGRQQCNASWFVAAALFSRLCCV